MKRQFRVLRGNIYENNKREILAYIKVGLFIALLSPAASFSSLFFLLMFQGWKCTAKCIPLFKCPSALGDHSQATALRRNSSSTRIDATVQAHRQAVAGGVDRIDRCVELARFVAIDVQDRAEHFSFELVDARRPSRKSSE